MNQHWLLLTHGNPLGTVKKFLRDLFHEAQLEGLLVPALVEGSKGMHVTPRLLRNPEELSDTAPFVPFMPVNSAGMLPPLAHQYPGEKLGVVLRACEMRALTEMAEREIFDMNAFVLIGVDCLGTFQIPEEAWWDNLEQVTNKVLQFARQGGIAAYRNRPACQMCPSPMVDVADLSIGVLGMPAQQFIIVTAQDEATSRKFHLKRITDGVASPAILEQREKIRSSTEGRHERARARIIGALEDELAMTVDDLVAHLADCEICKDNLEACPICTHGERIFTADGSVDRDAVIRWLSSCAGCGMCEQRDPEHLPLSAIFGRLQHELTELIKEDDPDFAPLLT
jgi:formate dehydrogenase subunit beta